MNLDRDALIAPPPEVWVDEFGDYLFAYAYTQVQNREMAEDVVQETFRRAFKARNQFKGRSKFRTWLTTILRNIVFDQRRRAIRMPTVSMHDPDAFPSVEMFEDESVPGPADLADRQDFWEHLETCLKRLKPRSEAMFRERYIEGRSVGDLAEKHGISENNAWVIMHRVRKMIAGCLRLVGICPKEDQDQTGK